MLDMTEPPPPEPEQPKTHTLTIQSGEAEIRHTYIQQQDGSWRLGNVDRKDGDDPSRAGKPRAGWPKAGVPAAEKKDQPRADQPEPRQPTVQEAQQALQSLVGCRRSRGRNSSNRVGKGEGSRCPPKSRPIGSTVNRFEGGREATWRRWAGTWFPVAGRDLQGRAISRWAAVPSATYDEVNGCTARLITGVFLCGARCSPFS